MGQWIFNCSSSFLAFFHIFRLGVPSICVGVCFIHLPRYYLLKGVCSSYSSESGTVPFRFYGLRSKIHTVTLLFLLHSVCIEIAMIIPHALFNGLARTAAENHSWTLWPLNWWTFGFHTAIGTWLLFPQNGMSFQHKSCRRFAKGCRCLGLDIKGWWTNKIWWQMDTHDVTKMVPWMQVEDSNCARILRRP